MNSDNDSYFRRLWNPLSDPTLPLREPDAGPWLVEGDPFAGSFSGNRMGATFLIMAACVEEAAVRKAEGRPVSTFLLVTSRPDRINLFAEFHRFPSGKKFAETPLPNVIPGVLIRTQADADRLLPELLRVPAARRMVVLRGEVDIHKFLFVGREGGWEYWGAPSGFLGWIAVDPADPASEQWLQETRRQCRSARVPLWCGPLIGGELVREWPEGISDGSSL